VSFQNNREIYVSTYGIDGPDYTFIWDSDDLDGAEGTISVVEDLTGDGSMDVMVSHSKIRGDTDPMTGHRPHDVGRVYVFEGGDYDGGPALMNGAEVVTSLDDFAMRFDGFESNKLGYAIATMDGNGDGERDVLLAGRNCGPPIRGKCTSLWYGPFDSTGPVYSSETADGWFMGEAVINSPGDVNSDGYDDFWLGTSSGELYLFHGAP
jgi:hypothetical protein